MTADKNFKRVVRERASRTGESYAAARRAIAARQRGAGAGGACHGGPWLSRAAPTHPAKAPRLLYERHAIAVEGNGVVVESEFGFMSRGLRRYRVRSDGPRRRSHYEYCDGEIVVEAGVTGDRWAGTTNAGECFSFEVDPSVALPSLAGRFLPLSLPRLRGEVAEYVPMPEDGYPLWRPRSGQRWLPVVAAGGGLSGARRLVVVGVGDEHVTIGAESVRAFRFDHVDARGIGRASTWVGPGGQVAYQDAGCTLQAQDPQGAGRRRAGVSNLA